MPAGQDLQTRADFINWVNTSLHAHENQPYQYAGIDVYAARCAMLHTFGAEAAAHRQDPDIGKFIYSDGGAHVYDPAVSPNVVIIGTASFLNDVVIAVGDFMGACQKDAALRQRVAARLPSIYQSKPFPQLIHEGPQGDPA